MTRILLVSHETSRTGAPRVAVMVARTLVRSGHAVQTVARAPGPLLPELAAAAPTVVEPFGRARRRLWRWRATRGLALALDTVVALTVLLVRRPDLLYLNSTSSASYVRPARWLRVPALLHAHESGAVAQTFLTANRVAPDLAGVRLVACSPSVQRDLAALTGRPLDEVTMLPSVPDGDLVAGRALEATVEPELGDGLVVGACGTVEARKGHDLWIDVARRVRQTAPSLDVSFVWVGDLAETEPTDPSVATFLGPRANPYPYLRRFDVLTLTSRDDPFPLVVLEAMALGTPVVAFDVGAVALQVGEAGVVVPAGDVETFSDRLVELLLDDRRRRALSHAARDRVATRYSAASFSRDLVGIVGKPSGTD